MRNSMSRLAASCRARIVGMSGMLTLMLPLIVSAMVVLPTVARAQTMVASIDPGMSRDQVVAKLGEPLSSRSYQDFTYLLYHNGCEKACGMSDLVVLDSGKVVDAVFRSKDRHYTGTSSSPHMIPAPEARKHKGSTAELSTTPVAAQRKPAPATSASKSSAKKPAS